MWRLLAERELRLEQLLALVVLGGGVAQKQHLPTHTPPPPVSSGVGARRRVALRWRLGPHQLRAEGRHVPLAEHPPLQREGLEAS